MKIIITGKLGIVKTTVCRKLIKIARRHGYHCAGLLTEKDESNNLIVRDIVSGIQHSLAQCKTSRSHSHDCRYEFDPKGFDFGNRILNSIKNTDIIIIDEIGPQEFQGTGFSSFIRYLRNGTSSHTILTVRTSILNHFLDQYNH